MAAGSAPHQAGSAWQAILTFPPPIFSSHRALQATRAYLHAEADVEAALNRAGFQVTKREMTATSFYFSRLLEAKRVR